MNIDKSNVIVGLILFLFLSIVIGLQSQNWPMSFLFSGGLTILILIWMSITKMFGKKKNQSIISSELFQGFINTNFIKEQYGEYHGIIGKINGHSVRIYYDWNKNSKGLFSLGDIVVILYFEPLVIDYISYDIQTDRIKTLQDEYYSISKMGLQKIFNVDRLILTMNYYPTTSEKKVRENIQIGLEMLQKANLKELDLNNLPKELEEYKIEGGFLPNTELIWDYFEEKNKRQ